MRINLKESYFRHKENTKKYAAERIYGKLYTIFEGNEDKESDVFFNAEDNIEQEVIEHSYIRSLGGFIHMQQFNNTEEESEDEEIGAFVISPQQGNFLNVDVAGVCGGEVRDSGLSWINFLSLP